MKHLERILNITCATIPSQTNTFAINIRFGRSWAVLTLVLFAAGCATGYRPQVRLTAVQTQADLERAMTICEEKASGSIPTRIKALSAAEDTMRGFMLFLRLGDPFLPPLPLQPMGEIALGGAKLIDKVVEGSTTYNPSASHYDTRSMYKYALHTCLKESGYTIEPDSAAMHDDQYATDKPSTVITRWEETIVPLPDSQRATDQAPVSPAPTPPAAPEQIPANN